MAMIFARMIREGNYTIERVPARWRAATQALLDAQPSAEAE